MARNCSASEAKPRRGLPLPTVLAHSAVLDLTSTDRTQCGCISRTVLVALSPGTRANQGMFERSDGTDGPYVVIRTLEAVQVG